MTVIDAGVLIDVALGRIDSASLGAVPLDTAHLMDSEFLHVLRRYNRLGLLSDRRADRILRWFDELTVTRHPVDGLHRRIWQLRHNLTAYDATYVALAESLGSRLLTRTGA